MLIVEGLLLLVIGMAAVYLFLLMMVFVMTAMRKPIEKLNHLLPDPAPPAPKRAPVSAADDAAIAIAIAAAAKC